MTIHHADILNWTPAYTGPLFHAALMDAPYEMEFMGKGWDNSGVAFNPETWRGIGRCLLPGAFLFVMAGTLNDDLISVAMREAGLRKYHKMVYWGYGSGFPKATNIASGIDAHAFRAWLKEHPDAAHLLKTARQAERNARRGKRTENAKKLKLVAAQLEAELKKEAGLTGAVVSTKKHQPKFAAAELGYRKKDNGFNLRDRETFDVLAPATEAAAAWLGHRYGGQMIKPAVESVLIFQKPYEGSALDCITTTGAGALWIDGGRIDGDKPLRETTNGDEGMFGLGSRLAVGTSSEGRWPANLLLSHAPTCNGHCAPGCPVAALGAQSGETGNGYRTNPSRPSQDRIAMGKFDEDNVRGERGHDDSGTAARFFFQADYMAERLELADAIQYVAKASRAEREAGLDPRQTALMRLLDEDGGDEFEEIEQTVYSGKRYTVRRCPEHDGTIPSGSNHYSCGCSLVRGAQFAPTTVSDGRETPIDNPYQRGETTRRNIDQTQKREYITITFSGKDENGIWVKADQKVMLQVDTAVSPPRVIDAFMTAPLDASAWNTMLFGSESEGLSLLASKSITLTKISSTIESKTLNWLLHSFTSVYTADVSSEQMDGGSHAENAESSSPSISFILIDPVSVPGAVHAASGTQWTISADDNPAFPQTTINDGRETPIDNPYQRGETARRNIHPCVKPISLTRYLATLLLPPPEYGPRRLLVPFCGAGSEIIGADLAGWEEVVGVELGADHVAIANARRAYWRQRGWELVDAARKLTIQSAAKIPAGQADMFEVTT